MVYYCGQVFLLFSLLLIATRQSAVAQPSGQLRFANYYGDHMVLQRAPASAVVWGYEPDCDAVSVNFNGGTVNADLVPGDGTCKWKAMLPATKAGGPYTITASSKKNGNASLQDVLFGDVWICGGQSNMVFTVPQAFNAAEEIAKADKYPDIRLFTSKLIASEIPKEELMGVLQPWEVASSAAVNGSAWSYFSATCWFFGVNLYDSVQVPLGLIASCWGGTRIEAWSSPDAIKECPMTEETKKKGHIGAVNPNTPTVLWNSMMHPFINMTIYGAIWYQGEANAGYRTDQYVCTFPAMINDWRDKWHQGTGGQTDPMFPFGFVQLAAYGNENKTTGGFPIIRWAQTANMGYVPNSVLKKVFMAVATDLGDPTSPYGSIHPRYKQDVGARLAMAADVVAYNKPNVYYTGPIASKAAVSVLNPGEVQINVSFQMTSGKIEIRSNDGFEISCVSPKDTQWLEGSIASPRFDTSVLIWFAPCNIGYTMKQIRYDWRQDPCVYKKCAVYSNELPAPPFIIDITPSPPLPDTL